VKITPELYFYKSVVELYVSRIKRYKNIHVELYRRSRDYLVLIGYNVFTENSGDWIDRAEVVKTDRKYLLVVIKEPLGFSIPKNGELRPNDTEPDIIKLESDMIVYLSLLIQVIFIKKLYVLLHYFAFIEREKLKNIYKELFYGMY